MLKLVAFSLLVFGFTTLYILVRRHCFRSNLVKISYDPEEAVKKSLEETKRELDGD